MREKRCVFLFILMLQFSLGFAQNNYPFIPQNQHQLTEKQLESAQINITPNVLLFTENGKLLPMSSLSLMTNPDYKPIFYADANEKVKSVVFQKKSHHPIIIEQNTEAQYTKGEPALDFLATDLIGKSYKLSQLKGKVVVLNFWFTKCGPCVAEMPALNELVDLYKDKDVVFLAITFNKKEIVTQFLKSQSFNYTILANANDITNMYGVQIYPTNIIINKKGEIVLKELGYRTNIKEVLQASINELL
ncbi:peroxiredoxin family protein [Lacinutrix iliipiscaria]|uniref:Peroxiredoxin family protein n=1 Tax=Lacinutrix iliipiscaria TaxID=1230532 RepID=A0ABW5WJ02_9FLAO